MISFSCNTQDNSPVVIGFSTGENGERSDITLESNFADKTNQKIFNKAYEQGIWINFPVNIVGEGESTVLDMVKTYSDYPLSGDDRADSGSTKNDG